MSLVNLHLSLSFALGYSSCRLFVLNQRSSLTMLSETKSETVVVIGRGLESLLSLSHNRFLPTAEFLSPRT